MKQEPLDRALHLHTFASSLNPAQLAFLSGCTKNQRFEKGDYLFKEGDHPKHLFLIRTGRIALESHQPGRGTLVVETCEDGDVLGWSALFEPSALDARALTPTVVFSVDGECLLRKMDSDQAFGYNVTRRLLEVIHRRLVRARLQQLDIYRGKS